MTVSTRKRNGPLSYLRQTVLGLPTTNNNLPLILFLSALTLIVRNNRLKHLVKDAGRFKDFSTDNLKYLVQTLGEQLNILAGETARQLDFQESNEEVWQSIWQSLQNKHLDSLWASETTLGYIYQFLCLPQRTQSLSLLSQSDKTIDAQTLIAFTQLYTPDWVADYLLQNTIMPQQRLFSADKLTVLDPACGAGHFLVRAFNILSELYIAEGATEKEACQNIVKYNLYGTDIDERSLAVAALSLLVRILKTREIADLPSLHLATATNSDHLKNMLGSLNRQWPSNHPLSRKYRSVVTNPPYIGRKLLDRSLKQALKTDYPNSHNDLANAFLERCLELSEPAGMVGMITQASIISLPSYAALRKSLLDKTCLDTCVELGPGVFPLQSGEKINSLLLILKNSPFKSQSKQTIRFIDLKESKDKAVELTEIDASNSHNHYEVSQNTLAHNDNQVFNYRSPSIVHRFLNETKSLASLAEIRQGLATTDNGRFLRYWWDVDKHAIGQKWFPYAKGAGVKRWHSPIKHLVNWQNDGQEIKDAVTSAYPYLNGKSAWVVKNEKYYFRQGLTFSFIGGQDLAVRYLPAGCIFDVAGSAIFVDDQSIFCYLAYLNSSFVRALANSLNPSINFQVGDLKKLPVLNFSENEKTELATAAEKCFALKEWLNGFDPTVFNAQLPIELAGILEGSSIEKNWHSYASKQKQATNELVALEEKIDQLVINAVTRQWSLNQADLETLIDWIRKACPQTKSPEVILNSLEFAKISLYHLIQKYLRENSSLTFALDQIPADYFQLGQENTVWLSSLLKQPISTYLTEGFMIDQAKQFNNSPQLFCQKVKGNGHAILFSTQALRDIQEKRKLPQGTNELNMLQSLASKMSEIPDWTGKQLLSFL